MLYFVPGAKRSITYAEVCALSIGHAFEGRFAASEVFDGPTGTAGVVLSHDALRWLPAFYRERQTWRSVPGSTAWVGRYDDLPLEPAHLLRRDALRGHLVTLADGQEWQIPVARGASEREGELVCYVNLPQYTEVDDAGEWREGAIVPRYAELWQHACDWWDTLRGARVEGEGDETQAGLSFAGLHDAALAALAANYRLGKPEASLLRLFTKPHAVEVLKALVDWPTVAEFLKKKAEASAG